MEQKVSCSQITVHNSTLILDYLVRSKKNTKHDCTPHHDCIPHHWLHPVAFQDAIQHHPEKLKQNKNRTRCASGVGLSRQATLLVVARLLVVYE